jgi:[amino group carrier protein]-lysine/ornithine hydrolase
VLDPLETLQKAIAIPSLSGQETEVAKFFVQQMSSYCDEAFVDESGSAIGRFGSGPLKVYFLGHIDTVLGEIPVRIEDGKLYGRGSVDAKGPFCTAVVAASRLPTSLKEKITLRLIGATEEEASSSKGARYAVKTYPKPDMVIIGEPSNWDAMTLGYKGRLMAKLHIKKEHFHSAGEGTTASEDLVEGWLLLKKQAEHYNLEKQGIFEALQIMLQGVSSSTDGLYQTAEATIGYRLPPTLNPQHVETMARELLGAGLTLSFFGQEIAYRSEKDTALTRAFRLTIREKGGTPRFKVKTGTSDMNVVAPDWNVPMLAYGPGDSALDHTPHEHIDLEEYEKAVTVLTSVFSALALR